MIRHTPLRDKLKLSWAILTSRAKVYFVENKEWAQEVTVYIEPGELIGADR